MDRYTQERIDMITGMIMVITNMQESDVKDLISTTIVYRNIIRGEECTLYEDYSANLMSIVKELRRKNVESGICEITSDKVSDLNQQIFSLGIRNADQLKKKLCRSQVVEVKAVTDISNERAFNSPHFFRTYRKKVSASANMALGSRKKKNAMPYGIAACRAMKGLGSNHGRSGRITASDRIRKSSARTNKNGFGSGRVK